MSVRRQAESKPEALELIVTASGTLKTIYDERLDLACFGTPEIRRGSHVEPTEDGRWTADLSPCGGPLLGPFSRRSAALAAELQWLRENWLVDPQGESCLPSLRHPRREPDRYPQLYRVQSIVWDTDGIDPQVLDLPCEVLMQGDPERFADMLSDEYGWCVTGLDVSPLAETLGGDELQRLRQLPLLTAVTVPVVMHLPRSPGDSGTAPDSDAAAGGDR